MQLTIECLWVLARIGIFAGDLVCYSPYSRMPRPGYESYTLVDVRKIFSDILKIWKQICVYVSKFKGDRKRKGGKSVRRHNSSHKYHKYHVGWFMSAPY